MIFSSKLLLFGEHIVIQGAHALAIPWHHYAGKWAWTKELHLQQQLPKFLNYLQDLSQQKELLAELDLDAFQRDLNKGLFFDSNIPTGYGAGSSGALCAAIYQRYLQEEAPKDLILLKRTLGQIESFFHGASSGTDPLICYLGEAVLIKGPTAINSIPFKLERNSNHPHFFVIDTGIKRETSPYVNGFIKNMEDAQFSKKVHQELIPSSNQAIAALLNQDYSLLWNQFRIISQIQQELLPDFIPNTFRQLWQEGLYSDDFLLKICGAGGGGFLLGLAKNEQAMRFIAKKYTLQKV